MKDFLSRDLEIGDYVIYTQRKYYGSILALGIIHEFIPNKSYSKDPQYDCVMVKRHKARPKSTNYLNYLEKEKERKENPVAPFESSDADINGVILIKAEKEIKDYSEIFPSKTNELIRISKEDIFLYFMIQ